MTLKKFITRSVILYIRRINRKSQKPDCVIDVWKITVRKNEHVLFTIHIILTFSSFTLSEKVKIAYLSCLIRPCLKFIAMLSMEALWSFKASCRVSVACAHCAKDSHSSETCNRPECCVIEMKLPIPFFPNWILERVLSC